VRMLLVVLMTIGCSVASFPACTEDLLPQNENSGDVRAWIDTRNPAPILFWGTEGQLALVLSNPTQKAVAVKVYLSVESFDGSIGEATFNLTIPPNDIKRQEIPPEVLGSFGIKWVRYRLEVDGRRMPDEETAFAYMHPAGPTYGKTEGVQFGIAYGAGGDNWSDGAAHLSAMCGAKIVRDHIPWQWIQPQEEVWNWEVADQIFSSHERYGIEVQALLSGAPEWAAKAALPGMKSARNRPPREKPWREWVSALAKRYDGHVRYWEIWNEPDIAFFNGTTEEYLQLLKAAYEELKAVNPENQVLTGGFASFLHPRRKPGMIETVVRDGNKWFDIFAYHRHGFFDEFQREIDTQLLPLLQTHLTEPPKLYFTETGMDTRVSERHQAITLVKKATFAWSRGAIAYTWFNLYDQDRTHGETYGLFTRNRLPKASYVACSALNRTLAGKHYIRQFEPTPDCWALLFGDDKEEVVVFWHENARTAAPHLVLRTNADNAIVQDIMGNRSRADVAEGRVVLQTGDAPSYLILPASDKEPEIEGELLTATGRCLAVPGRTQRVEADIWNPFEKESEFRYRWFVPSPLGERQFGDSVLVAPRSRKRIGLDISVPKTLRGRYGDVHTVDLNYQVAGTPWSGDLHIPMVLGAILVKPGDFPKEPAFTLNRQDQVVNLAEHDPNSQYLLWTDPRDLSAKVWLAWADGALKVHVAVQDDVFSQSGVKQRLCEGDSVRLALEIPGQKGLLQLDLADVRRHAVTEVVSGSLPRDVAASRPNMTVVRDNANRTYEIVLPGAIVGLSDKVLRQGIRFNVFVNDNDGKGRKGWMEAGLSPGRDPDIKYFPMLVLEP